MLDPGYIPCRDKDGFTPSVGHAESVKPKKKLKKALSDVGYPKGPCSERYDGNPFLFTEPATLAGLKTLCDQAGIQLEITIKPTSIRFAFIKANQEDGSVKRKQYLFKNESIKELDGARFSRMVLESVYGS